MKYLENKRLVFKLGFYSVLAVIIYRFRKKLGLFKRNYVNTKFSKNDIFFSDDIETPFCNLKPRGLYIELFGHIHLDLKNDDFGWNKTT